MTRWKTDPGEIRLYFRNNGYILSQGYYSRYALGPVVEFDWQRAIVSVKGKQIASMLVTCCICGKRGQGIPFDSSSRNFHLYPTYFCFGCYLERQHKLEHERIHALCETNGIHKCDICKCFSKTKLGEKYTLPLFPDELPLSPSGRKQRTYWSYYRVCSSCAPLVSKLHMEFKKLESNSNHIKQLNMEIRNARKETNKN